MALKLFPKGYKTHQNMYLKLQKCQEKSRNTVIAHRSRWYVSRSNEYKFATSMQWMD